MICTNLLTNSTVTRRCNLLSLHVKPDFRAYAPLLRFQVLREKEVTHLNISPKPHTWPIIEAQGFSRYFDGVFVTVPLLCEWFGGAGVKVSAARQ